MSTFTGFFDNFLRGVTNPKGNLGDYRHAARLYIDNNMRLAPKFKFLYHVVLNINPQIRQLFPLVNELPRNEVNLLCKSADLPKYNPQTTTVNQYNRKKVIQTSIQYQPVTLDFHDDNAGLTSLLWECYYRYYFSDGNYTRRQVDGSPAITVREYQKASNGLNTMYAGEGFNSNKYGLDRPNKPVDFFSSIQIFQLHAQSGKPTYTSFTLINPKIDQFQHDRVDQSASEFTLNTMTVSYETVLYNRGETSVGNAPAGFAETHYDRVPSPLTIDGGGTRSLFGAGGIIAGLANAIDDVQSGNILRAAIRAKNISQNIGDLSSRDIAAEITGLVVNTVDNISIPSSTSRQTSTNSTPKQF
jgi:hypothetical protein